MGKNQSGGALEGRGGEGRDEERGEGGSHLAYSFFSLTDVNIWGHASGCIVIFLHFHPF